MGNGLTRSCSLKLGAGLGTHIRRHFDAVWAAAQSHTTAGRQNPNMPTILQFIQNLGLDKADEATLRQHVQDCYTQAGGPSLDDNCTEHVR